MEQLQRERERQRERQRQTRATSAARVRQDNRAHLLDREGVDAEPAAGAAPASRTVPAPPMPVPPATAPARRGLAGLLASRDALRQAVVLAEVLGPPKGLPVPAFPQRRATAPIERAAAIPAVRDDHEDRRSGRETAGDGDA